MKPEHSPLPWFALDFRDDYYTIKSGQITVALAKQVGVDPSQRKPNVLFIERAVNNHDALVEALRRLMALISQSGSILKDGDAFHRASEVLAKLEAGK